MDLQAKVKRFPNAENFPARLLELNLKFFETTTDRARKGTRDDLIKRVSG
ncbi:hypothetical protein [Haloferula sp. BvORR071]|nr:hypothetical protein [Haloferula sp. BvORR071]